MTPLTVFAPAKLNLFLAVTGRRPDGFHDLVSLVTPLDFGDTLQIEPAATFTLACDDPAVPTDQSNLVLRAADAFAIAARQRGSRVAGAHFTLTKRVPMGAGLGGGSSDAAAALRGLNELAGRVLDENTLENVAAQIGSDCPLFLRGAAVVMRGRGERLSDLPEAARARLSGRRVLLFKPAFAIPTAWAYHRLAAGAPASYARADEAERRLEHWVQSTAAPAEDLLFNNMEPPAFTKFVALPALLEQIRAEFGLNPHMSGSGSACFAFLHGGISVEAVMNLIRRAWGESVFMAEARLT